MMILLPTQRLKNKGINCNKKGELKNSPFFMLKNKSRR